MAVLVTDGNQRSTLAVVRALGQNGIPVAVGEDQASSLAGASRYCAKKIRYPSPLQEAERFVDFLQDELCSGGYEILIPTTDVSMQLVAGARQRLASLVRMPFPGPDQMEQVQDKRRTLLQARAVGIASPETFMLEATESIEEVAGKIRYPAVLKPRFSCFRRGGEWVKGPVRYAQDPAGLVAEYNRIHRVIPNPLVQEKVEGEGRGVFLLVWNGELKAAMCHRRLREKPPWGGVSVLSESLPPDRDLVDKSFSLLKALDWQGVAMVEYKLDNRDAQAKLMEVNGRFWGSLQLAIDAGMNFPLLLYRLAKGEDVPPQFEYKAGIRNRWLLGDLDHLLTRCRYSRAPNGSPLPGPSRFGTLVDFMKFYQKDMHYEVESFNDLGPSGFEFWHYVRDILGFSKPGKEAGAR